MTPWHAALCSLLSGICAGGLTYFLLTSPWRKTRLADAASLVDSQALLTALRESAHYRVHKPFDTRMRWAGIPIGSKALAALSAGISAAAVFGLLRAGIGPGLTALAAVFIALLPSSFVRFLIARKERASAEGLEPLVEGMLRGLASGLDVRASFALALGSTPKPLASALEPVARSLMLGRSISDCMTILRSLAPIPAAHLLAAAMTVQSQSGGHLRDCLEGIAGMLREEKRMRGKRDAAAAEARSASAILVLAPVALLAGMAALSPRSFALLAGTATGQAALTLSALSVAAGHLVIRRMVAVALPRSMGG